MLIVFRKVLRKEDVCVRLLCSGVLPLEAARRREAVTSYFKRRLVRTSEMSVTINCMSETSLRRVSHLTSRLRITRVILAVKVCCVRNVPRDTCHATVRLGRG